MAFLHQRREAPGPFEIDLIAAAGADRIGRRRSVRVPLLGAAERAAGQHADVDDAHIGGFCVRQQIAEILRREAGRHRRARARVQQVVADLGGVEDMGIDDPVQRRSVAGRGDPEEADFALLPQPLEGRHDLIEHCVGAEIGARGRADNRVVELEEVDPLHLQTIEAGFQRGGDRGADLAALGGRQPHLGADISVGLQRLPDPAEVLFALAVAVHRGRVEVVDAEFERPGDGALLFGGHPLDHEPADRAAAEAEQRYLEPRPAEPPFFHAPLLF
jgi:hypothetical protein